MVSIDFMVSKDKCSRACLRSFLLLALLGSPVVADNEWSQHGADRRATKFADLTQIHDTPLVWARSSHADSVYSIMEQLESSWEEAPKD
jgi:hypothetical protein